MRAVVMIGLVWLLASQAIAQQSPPRWVEPGTTIEQAPPAPVGSCVGGSCAGRGVPKGLPVPQPKSTARLARGAAIFGIVSAGLMLGGAIAIAVVDDPGSEIATRSAWLGYAAVSTPIVALAAYRSRRHRRSVGSQSARRLGWVAYSAVISQGVLQLALAVRGTQTPPALTVGSGIFAMLSILPHAFDAYVSGRSARTRPRAVMHPTLTGLHVRF